MNSLQNNAFNPCTQLDGSVNINLRIYNSMYSSQNNAWNPCIQLDGVVNINLRIYNLHVAVIIVRVKYFYTQEFLGGKGGESLPLWPWFAPFANHTYM